MEIKEKTRKAALAARGCIRMGCSIKTCNDAFNEIAGFHLKYKDRKDFMRLVNFYADQK